MQTNHRFLFKTSSDISEVDSESVDLMITSPPYPMIQMWDSIFIGQDPVIEKALTVGDGKIAFERMNVILDSVWKEMDRVLKPGGIVCINIGDATRTLNKSFSLYPSHARILSFFYKRDYYNLPEILWRKQVNSPNKYMGSGMLPVGAYTTLEHEFIIVLRKGAKRREFKSEEEKTSRRESAFFWEERNLWFSDVWFDIKGTKQRLINDNLRERSAAYPFELPYRLINMFSVKGDIVLDPYLGTGTTSVAAAVAGRNSIGVEIVEEFKDIIYNRFDNIIGFGNKIIENRIERHIEFVKERTNLGKDLKYKNDFYGFQVISKQETRIKFDNLINVSKNEDCFSIEY